MAEVQAFAGIRYRLGSADEAGAVICPPYDVIGPAEQQLLLDKDPRNVVRLELPQEEPGDDSDRNRYTRAAALFREWLQSGVLRRDPQPCLYVYGQRYQTESGPQERLGVVGALKAEPYEAGVVLPHEQTFPKHKEDRFRLLSTAKAQFSPIFGLYSAPEAAVRAQLDRWATNPPDARAVDREGVEHRFWAISDPDFARWASQMFAGRQVFIADGHHRYETALRYRAERRAEATDSPDSPFDFVMTFLVEMDDPGLVLLPTHRLVRALPESGWPRLAEYFDSETVSIEEVDQLQHHQIGLVRPGAPPVRLTLKDPRALDGLDHGHSAAWRDLDVAILHRLVFEVLFGLEPEIVYTRDAAEAKERGSSGEFAAAFLQPHPQVEELKQVAGAGDKMPQKSTYFWPKAVTGLVIYGE
jgi:uncharacterized protein (DUF1015 family)